MPIKVFQKGHIVSDETRRKISKANDGNYFAKCDYCGVVFHTKKSAAERRKRHFCSRKCYAKYRSEILPREEQNSYGTGMDKEERKRREKARSILNHYLRDNNIKRPPCEMCGNPKTEAHHDDYDKPLEVRWLCFNCHRKWHTDNPELVKE